MLTNVNNSTLFKYKLKREGETKWRLRRLSTKKLRKISEQALYNLNWLGSRQLRKRLLVLGFTSLTFQTEPNTYHLN